MTDCSIPVPVQEISIRPGLPRPRGISPSPAPALLLLLPLPSASDQQLAAHFFRSSRGRLRRGFTSSQHSFQRRTQGSRFARFLLIPFPILRFPCPLPSSSSVCCVAALRSLFGRAVGFFFSFLFSFSGQRTQGRKEGREAYGAPR